MRPEMIVAAKSMARDITCEAIKARGPGWAFLSQRGRLDACRAILCTRILSRAPGNELDLALCRAVHAELLEECAGGDL